MRSKKKQYSEETMAVALKMVNSGVLTVCKAAKTFGIPKTTLSDKKNQLYRGDKAGQPTKLLKKGEDALQEWILLQDQAGCPVNIKIIKQKAEEMLKARTGEESFLGCRWCHRFVKRHPAVDDVYQRHKNKSKKGKSSKKNRDLQNIEVKDEFGDCEAKFHADSEYTTSSDDGAFSSQSLTFGELGQMSEDNPNFNFCMSMFSEMSKMNDEQLMDLRLKTQQFLKEILKNN